MFHINFFLRLNTMISFNSIQMNWHFFLSSLSIVVDIVSRHSIAIEIKINRIPSWLFDSGRKSKHPCDRLGSITSPTTLIPSTLILLLYFFFSCDSINANHSIAPTTLLNRISFDRSPDWTPISFISRPCHSATTIHRNVQVGPTENRALHASFSLRTFQLDNCLL